MPRLEDFLKIVVGHMAVNIELKEPGYEAEALSVCLAKLEPDDVVVTSFSETAVATAKQLVPQVSAGLLVGRLDPCRPCSGTSFPSGDYRLVGGLPGRAPFRLLATGIARRAEQRGVGVLVWTVDDSRLIDRYLAGATDARRRDQRHRPADNTHDV